MVELSAPLAPAEEIPCAQDIPGAGAGDPLPDRPHEPLCRGGRGALRETRSCLGHGADARRLPQWQRRTAQTAACCYRRPLS